MKQEEEQKGFQTEKKPSPKPRLPDPQSVKRRELAWADRADDGKPEPTEETYRDGSMKNECW